MGSKISCMAFAPSKQQAAEALVCVVEQAGFVILRKTTTVNPKKYKGSIGIAQKIEEDIKGRWYIFVDGYGVYMFIIEKIDEYMYISKLEYVRPIHFEDGLRTEHIRPFQEDIDDPHFNLKCVVRPF